MLGSVSYSLLGRYNFYASARKDGANIFGVATNNKWKPLWSAGLSWDLSKEHFFNVKEIDLLRLRASYGYTGNANNTISALTTFGYAPRNNEYTGTPYAGLGLPPNPDLRWENVGILNLGVDFSILSNRITGTFEWFTKRSRDLIAPAAIDPTLGASNPEGVYMNVANTRGKGFDLGINSKNIIGVLNWSSTLNVSYAKVKVTRYHREEVYGLPLPGDINPREGQDAWSLYAYAWSGLDPATGDPQGRLKKEVSKDYQAIINDSVSNHVFVGSSLPLFFGNFMNTIQWKRFSLSANISYQFGYYFFKPAVMYSNLAIWSLVGSGDYAKRWQKPGDERTTSVPSVTYPLNANRDKFYQFSEVNAAKGDHIRLRDVRLAYDLPAFKNWPIKSLQLFAYVNNLNILIWRANDDGLDPEFSTGNYPPVRNWSFGLNLTF